MTTLLLQFIISQLWPCHGTDPRLWLQDSNTGSWSSPLAEEQGSMGNLDEICWILFL